MGTKKSQTSESQATATTSTTTPQTIPITPSTNRTRGRSTQSSATQSTATKPSVGTTKSQTESQQSEFPAPDTVRRSGRRTTLPKNLIHDSVIETPINRNRRESVASETPRRRNSSASSSKSSRKKLPAEKKTPAKEPQREPVVGYIKVKDQILTSSDEEFPPSHKKGSLHGYKRLPPMSPPPGLKTWETDSDVEERRGNRGNLGWGPMKVKEKKDTVIENSQDEGDTDSASQPDQDRESAPEKATAKSTKAPGLVIETDDSDRDYDAELSELDSSPMSTRARNTSEISEDQMGDDFEEDLQEQRPPKRRKLVLHDESDPEGDEEVGGHGYSSSSAHKNIVEDDDDMDVSMQDVGPHYNATEQLEALKEEENSQARIRENGNLGVSEDKKKASETSVVLDSVNNVEMENGSTHQEELMEIDKEEDEMQANPQGADELLQIERLESETTKTSPGIQTGVDIPASVQDTNMTDSDIHTNQYETTDMGHETTNEAVVEVSSPSHLTDEPKDAVEVGHAKPIDPSDENPSNSSQFQNNKNLQPTIEDITDEDDLPDTVVGIEEEIIRGGKDRSPSENSIIVEEERGNEGDVAIEADEISTPDEVIIPDEVEEVVGGEDTGTETYSPNIDVEFNDVDDLPNIGNDIGALDNEKREEEVEVEVEEVEASGAGAEAGIIDIEEVEESEKVEEARGADGETVTTQNEFTPQPVPMEDIEGKSAEIVEVDKTMNAPSQQRSLEVTSSADIGTPGPEPEEDSIGEAEVIQDKTPIRTPEESDLASSSQVVALQGMDVDGDNMNPQQQKGSSQTITQGDIEDSGVEKLRELSLGADGMDKAQTETVVEAMDGQIVEIIDEKHSEAEEVPTAINETNAANGAIVVDEIEISVSPAQVEVTEERSIPQVVEKGEVQSTIGTSTEAKVISNPMVTTDGSDERTDASCPSERNDEIMEDAEPLVESTHEAEEEDQQMQDDPEVEKDLTEKASDSAHETQANKEEQASEGQSSAEEQTSEDSTTVTAQQEQEQHTIEQQTEERQKESVAEEPELPPRPVDDLGAENNTVDEDDHITIYSSSSGLPSDDELGPDGVTRVGGRRSHTNGKRRRRTRWSKPTDEHVEEIIGHHQDYPQLDGPAFEEPSWNRGTDNFKFTVLPLVVEPLPKLRSDEPEFKSGESHDDEDTQLELTPDSPKPVEHDSSDDRDPEINEDVGLPPDLDVPGSEDPDNKQYDGKRDIYHDTHLGNGGGLMDLLHAAEFVEKIESIPLVQTRKEVIPARTFKMFGDAWERIGNGTIPRPPEKPHPFPDNIVNLGDWERVQYNKCPVCLELLVDVAANTMENAQTTQNAITEHIENCGKQKGSPETPRSKGRDLRNHRENKSVVPAAARAGEGVRRINLRVKLSDGTYFQNPTQAQSTPAAVELNTVKPPQIPTLNGIAAQLPKNATEYKRMLQDIEECDLLPNTRYIFKHFTGEREVHSDSEDSLPDAYEYDLEEYDTEATHPLPDEAYFMKTTPIAVFQARIQESFKRSYDHAFTEQENIIAVMTRLQAEYLDLEKEVAEREHRMPKRLRPLDTHVVFEDKKEADLYNYKYDPDPKKRGRQDPDAQRTDSVYVGGRELRGRARNRDGPPEFLQGRKKRGPIAVSQIPRPAGTRGPGRPRKEVPTGTDSGVTSMQPSRDGSIDVAVTPQASPAKRGKIIRNPRGYNGRNKPIEPVSLPPTRDPSPTPTPVLQAATAFPKKRGRKSNAEKAREAEEAAAAAAASTAVTDTDSQPMEEPQPEMTPKQATPVPVETNRRVSTRGRPPRSVAPQPTTDASEPAPSSSERQPTRSAMIKPAASKAETKSQLPKPIVTKPMGKRREILKLRMSSGGSAKAEQILSPITPARRPEQEKPAETPDKIEVDESVQEPQAKLKEETPPPASIDMEPTAPESFYGETTPCATVAPNPETPATPQASNGSSSSSSSVAPFTILPPTVSSPVQPPPLQFMPSRVVSTPAPVSPVTAGTPPAGSTQRQFFGNASRRARRGEFINSGVNNDSTPYKTYASGKVVGNAPVQVQMQDRAPTPEEPRTSVPPQPTANVQLDFVMDMTVPQQPMPPSVPAISTTPVPPPVTQQSPTTIAPPPPAPVIQPPPVVAPTKIRGRGGKGSTGAKGAGQSTFLPTITPDNWKLKKGVKQNVKTESQTATAPLREGSVFRDISARATPATSVGSTPITPSAPTFQAAEMMGQGQHPEWIAPAPILHANPAPQPICLPLPPIATMSTPPIPIVPMMAGGMNGYIHHHHPAHQSHPVHPVHQQRQSQQPLHSPVPTLTPFIKPPVDSPVPPYSGHQLPPIQQLNFVNSGPGGTKQKTRGKTYKKPTIGIDVPKPTKEEEFRALTGGQMDLGKRKRKSKGNGEGFGEMLEGQVAPAIGVYPGQSMMSGGFASNMPGSPKKFKFDSHMGIEPPQGAQGQPQGYGVVGSIPATQQRIPQHIPPRPMHYFSAGPGQDLAPLNPAMNMSAQPSSQTMTSERSDPQEHEGEEASQSRSSNSEERVPGEGSFQINMWRPPVQGTIGA